MSEPENTTENETVRTQTYQDDYIAGSCFLVTSSLTLLAYSAVLSAIALSKNLRYPCYGIMFSLGISDCASLIAWSLVGIHTITHGLVLPNALITHSLCVLVIGWGSLTVHFAILAINRFLAICFPEKHDDVFTKRGTCILIGFCWFYVLCFHSVPTFIPPHMTYSVQGYISNWENPKITAYYFVQDLTAVSIVSAIDLTCYTVIIIKYRQIRAQFTTLSTDAVKDRMRQFRLALQCMARCCAFFFCDLLYYLFGYVFIVDNFWFSFICSTYLWHLNNVLCPWIYLIFDTQLRKEVKVLILGSPLFKLIPFGQSNQSNGSWAKKVQPGARQA